MTFPEPTAEELETFREGETSQALIAFARRTKVEREGGLKFWMHLRQYFERTAFPKWHVDAQAALSVYHSERVTSIDPGLAPFLHLHPAASESTL